jgi:hypothetical protein
MTAETVDDLLEPLTQALVELVAGRLEEVTLRAGPLQLRFAGERDWLTLEVLGNSKLEPARRLRDAQTALLMGLGFAFDVAAEGPEDLFLELELEDGEAWDEQSLRDLALQGLGILYYIYDCRDVAEFKIDSG